MCSIARLLFSGKRLSKVRSMYYAGAVSDQFSRCSRTR
jgi:hypothetical protein